MTPRRSLEWFGGWPACVECAVMALHVDAQVLTSGNLRIYMQGHHDRHLDEALEERRAKKRGAA